MTRRNFTSAATNAIDEVVGAGELRAVELSLARRQLDAHLGLVGEEDLAAAAREAADSLWAARTR